MSVSEILTIGDNSNARFLSPIGLTSISFRQPTSPEGGSVACRFYNVCRISGGICPRKWKRLSQHTRSSVKIYFPRNRSETIEVAKVKGRKSDEVLFGDNDKKTARLPFSDRLTVSFLKTFIIRLWRNILFGYPPATKNFDFY